MERINIENFDNILRDNPNVNTLLSIYFNGGVFNDKAIALDYQPRTDDAPVLPDTLLDFSVNIFVPTNIVNENKRSLIRLMMQIISNNPVILAGTNIITRRFTRAIICVAITSSVINFDSVQRRITYADIPNTELDKTLYDEALESMKYLSIARNFIQMSVINFIRFNHHFPNNKRNIMKKAMIGLPNDYIDEIVSSDLAVAVNDVFFRCFVTSAKLVNDFLFFYVHMKGNLNNNYNRTIVGNRHALGYPISIHYPLKDEHIILRENPTTNGYLSLDLLSAVIKDVIASNLTFLVPHQNQINTLLRFRNTLIESPFAHHPARFYFGIVNANFDENNANFSANIAVVAGFLYEYCISLGGTVGLAPSKNKYSSYVKASDTTIVETITRVKESRIILTDEQLAGIKLWTQGTTVVPANREELITMNATSEGVIMNGI